MRVCVIGGGSVSDSVYQTAVEVGKQLGTRGHTVVCGGLGGVMEGVCRGVSGTVGRSIGILPGDDPSMANPYVDIALATGLGNARNVLVVLNGMGVVVINGGNGTLSEIGFALDLDRPIAGIDTFDIDGIKNVESPIQAIEFIEEMTGQ